MPFPAEIGDITDESFELDKSLSVAYLARHGTELLDCKVATDDPFT